MFEGLLPPGLLEKTNTVFLLSSGTADATAYVAGIYRVDPPDDAIDLQPYVLTFDHQASQASGYFVEHGNWPGRSIRPGSSFFDAIETSGIQHHFPYETFPGGSSGVMSDVSAHPEAGAFWKMMKQIRSDQS